MFTWYQWQNKRKKNSKFNDPEQAKLDLKLHPTKEAINDILFLLEKDTLINISEDKGQYEEINHIVWIDNEAS